MNNPTYEFKRLDSMEGFRVILPGRILRQAQAEKLSIPQDGGGWASLSETAWYDQYHLSQHDDIYSSITSMDFEPDAEYSVFFISQRVRTPYMLAIKLPLK